VVRTWEPVDAELRLTARWLPGPYRVAQLAAELANVSTTYSPSTPGGGAGGAPERGPARAAARDAALRHSLIAAHLVISAPGWRFLSMTDPPAWAAGFAAQCRNERLWPVLVAAGDTDLTGAVDDTVLAAPIILPDHPRVAPESVGMFFDATEIDELLALRTRTLTDEEKALARATDPRAAEVIDRADHLPAELLTRLHGAARDVHDGATREPVDPAGADAGSGWPSGATVAEIDAVDAYLRTGGAPWWDPGADRAVDPETDRVTVAGVAVAKGSRVRLAPSHASADAQDMFLAGRPATVAAVLRDVDGATHVAVTLDDDPGADLAGAVGRFRYFAPDELVPLGTPAAIDGREEPA
jgi:hypothetical protein